MLLKTGLGRPLGFGGVALGVVTASLAVSLTASRATGAPHPDPFHDEETTISVKGSADAQATVIRLPELAMGETRTVAADNGKTVTVTRTEAGYTIKVGEKEFQVKLLGGADRILISKDGHSTEDAHTIVTGDGVKKVVVMKHGFGFQSGEGSAASIGEMLDKQELKALRGADRRTRDTVLEALKELAESGAVIVPGAAHPMLLDVDGKGDHVQIKVLRKKSEEK